METPLDSRRVMPVLDHDRLSELLATPFPEVGIGVEVISWLGSLGYPDTAGGILTSGGSMANLMALSVAMHDKAPADLRNAGLSASSITAGCQHVGGSASFGGKAQRFSALD